MSRPVTAYHKSKPSSPSKNKQITLIKQPKNLNQSTNKLTLQITQQINQNNNQQNLTQKQQNIHETKSQKIHTNTNVQQKINKKYLLIMLMKYQIAKMGFQQKIYKNIVEQYMEKINMDIIGDINFRQWVLSKKSQVVDTVVKNIGEQSQIKNQKKKKNNQSGKKQQTKQQKKIANEYKQVQNMKKSNIYNQHQHQIQQQNVIKTVTFLNQTSIKVHPQSYAHQQVSQSSFNPSYQISSQYPHQQNIHTNTRNIPSMSFNLNNNVSQPTQQQIACPICLNITQHYIYRNCGHIFCKQCIRSYITQNIKNGNYLIDCLEYDCSQKINQIQAKLVLNNTLLQRFIKFKQKITLQNDPDNKFCNHPDCGKLLIKKSKNILQCQYCKLCFCQICQQIQHPGKQCGEILQNQINQTYLNFNIKKCPSCNAPIQKIDGCNHMTCKKCKAQFCWICLGKYTPYHYRIYNCCGCPGLQYDQAQSLSFHRFLQVLFFIFLPLIIALAITAVFLILPFFMLFDFLTKPCKWISNDQKCQQSILKLLCCCFPECLICFFTYFLMLPRSALVTVFISPIQYFAIIINIVYNVV